MSSLGSSASHNVDLASERSRMLQDIELKRWAVAQASDQLEFAEAQLAKFDRSFPNL